MEAILARMMLFLVGYSATAAVALPVTADNAIGVPGPIAAAGLPFLLAAGTYALVRGWRNRAR
jgi:hypothetical protein